jgi:hypothetical protein
VLHRECGIYFRGKYVPFELQKDGAKVRVTATIESDNRVSASWQTGGLLSDQKTQVFDVGSKFKRNHKDKSSDITRFAERTNEVDERPLMNTLARKMLDRWNVAMIHGTATLTGVDYDYAQVIGQTISGIDGRKVDFDLAPDQSGPRYPTIIGATLDFQSQQLHLVLDTFRGHAALAL